MKNVYEQPIAEIVSFESERVMSDPNIGGETPNVSVGLEQWD